MNITTLFRSTFTEPLLFNVEGESIVQGWNVSDLYKDVAQISSFLLGSGVNAHDPVLILSGNSVETLAFTLAVFNIGAIAVPVSPYIGHDVLVDIIGEVSPKCCFLEEALNTEIIIALENSCHLFICRENSVDEADLNFPCYAELLNGDESIQFGDFDAKHPALIIHTSGSQGRPKIIQMSHESLFFYFHYHDLIHRQFSDINSVGKLQKPLLSVFQPGHLASLSIALQGLLMRRPTYLLRGFSPPTYIKLLSRLNCRLSILVPSMYVKLLQEDALIDESDFSDLNLCAVVGEPCSDVLAERVEKVFDAACFSGYGLTECLPGIAHTWEDLNRQSIARGSSGRVLFDEVRLVDRGGNDTDRGELWIRNPTVHYCYKDDSLNQAKIQRDGWLKTGDLFYRDDSGSFFHKGRIDNMFVCNGKNIYPSEIESVLARHSLVENVIAAPVIDELGKSVPGAVVQSPVDIAESELMEFFLKVGPGHAIPRVFNVMQHLPELGPGKIDREACKQLLQECANALPD